jgi:hypothetical protein
VCRQIVDDDGVAALESGLQTLFEIVVARYRRLLERVTEESDRQTIFNLLAEEQQKQKNAGDPI